MDKAIRQQIMLEVRAQGLSGTAKEINAVNNAFRALMENNKKLATDYGAQVAAIARLTQAYAQAEKATARSSEAQKTAVEGLAKAFDVLDKGVKSALDKIIGFSSFAGFISAAKSSMDMLKQYNDNVLLAGAAAARYGIGITEIEGKLNSLSNTLSLTRAETMKLFKQYEQSFGSFSMRGFEGVLKNIQKVVGPSSQAIGDMMGQLSGVLAKMPDLQVQMERMNKSDRDSLELSAQRMRAAGQLSATEYKAFETYISQSDQASAKDKARQQELIENQKTFQDFAKQAESIGLMLAQALMPIFKEMGDWLKGHQADVKQFFGYMADGVKFAVGHSKELIPLLKGMVAIWAGGKLFAMFQGLKGAGQMMQGLFSGGAGQPSSGAGGTGGSGGGMVAGEAEATAGMLGSGSAGSGLIGTLKSRLPGAAAYGAGGLAAEAAGWGLGKLQEHEEGEGDYTAAGAAGIGSYAAKGAGGALTGAAIGSMILPGVGTAVGAVVGGFIELYRNSDLLSKSFDELSGKAQSDDDASTADARTSIDAFYAKGPNNQGEDEDTHAAQHQKDIEDATQSVREHPLTAQSFQDNQQSLASLQQKFAPVKDQYEKALQMSGRDYKGKRYSLADETSVGGDGKTVYSRKDFEKQMGNTESHMSKVEENMGNEQNPRKKAAMLKEYDMLKQDLAEQKEISNELNKSHDEVGGMIKGYTEFSDQIDIAKAKQKALNEELDREVAMSNAMTANAQASLGFYDSLLERAKQIGDVSKFQLVNELNKVRANAEKASDELGVLIKLKQAMGDNTPESKAQTEKYMKDKGINPAGPDAGDIAKNMLEADITNKQKEQNSLQVSADLAETKIGDRLQGQIGLLESQVQLHQKVIQISDSMATGLGAQIQSRMQLADAQQKEYDMIKQSDRELQEQHTAGKEILAYDQKRLDNANKMLALQQQMGENLKAMRDGWIDALGAANTVSGKFTKITVSQNQNLSALLNNFGGLSTFRTGATKNVGPDADKPVGWNEGKQATSQFGVYTGQTGGANGGATPYTTWRGNQDAAMYQHIMRGQATDLTNDLEGKNIKQSAGQGWAGMAATASPNEMGTSEGMSNVSGSKVYGRGFRSLPDNSSSGGPSTKPSSPSSNAAGSQGLNVIIPSLAVNVVWDQLPQLKQIIKEAFEDQLSKVVATVADGGGGGNSKTGNGWAS